MKKTILLSFITLFIINVMYSQKYELNNIPLHEGIKLISDSIRKKKTFYSVSCSNTQNSFSYEIEKRISRLTIYFPVPDEKETAIKVFNVIDSLAKTKIYTNKLIAGKISMLFYNHYTSNLLDTCERKRLSGWKKDFLINLTLTYIDNCIKYTGVSVLEYLPSSVYSPAVKNKIKFYINNQQTTREEAEIKSQIRKAKVVDTIGYSVILKKIKEGKHISDKKAKWGYFIKMDLADAKKVNLSLKQYYDSLNLVSKNRSIEIHMNNPLTSLEYVIRHIIDERVYSMAPFIDSLYQSGYCSSWKDFDINQSLALLNYKDYQIKQINKNSAILDSLVIEINKPKLKQTDILKLYEKINSVMSNLKEIGTQKALSKLAPVLLINKEVLLVDEGFSEESAYLLPIAARYFVEFSNFILNFPVDKKLLNLLLDPTSLNTWEIGEKFPKDFFKKMYIWMIKNEGNYEICKRWL